MDPSKLPFMSQPCSWQATLPTVLNHLFLKGFPEHTYSNGWLAFALAVAAASLLINYPRLLSTSKVKTASIPKGPLGLLVLGTYMSM
jgi:hypothetical protein